jgi:hypothetical protein
VYDLQRIRRIKEGIDEDGYRELYGSLQATAERMEIRFRLNHDSLGAFVKAHPDLARMPSLLRDSVVDPPFEALLDALDSPATGST